MKIRILINQGGGSVADRKPIEDALAAAALDADVRWLKGEELEKEAKAALEEGVGTIVAGGGDGTISAVAGVLAGSKKTLGILPLGTLNHFARDLGIPVELEDAAKLLAKGKARPIDVAEVNGRIFINNSSVGLYPLMVNDREAQQRRLGRTKRMAMLVAAARTLFRFKLDRLTLRVGGHSATVQTPLLFVGNNAYKLEMPGSGTRESLDSGELSVFLLRRKSRLGFIAASVRALFGRHGRLDVIDMKDVRQLCVESRRPMIPVSMDGETVRLETPLNYKILPKALRVITP